MWLNKLGLFTHKFKTINLTKCRLYQQCDYDKRLIQKEFTNKCWHYNLQGLSDYSSQVFPRTQNNISLFQYKTSSLSKVIFIQQNTAFIPLCAIVWASIFFNPNNVPCFQLTQCRLFSTHTMYNYLFCFNVIKFLTDKSNTFVINQVPLINYHISMK